MYHDKSKSVFYFDGQEFDFGAGRRCGAMCFVCTCRDYFPIFDFQILNQYIMKNTRAKFNLSVTNHEDGSMSVSGSAVTNGSEENKSFAEFTPSGSFSMIISKDTPAQETFAGGSGEYFLDITPCQADAVNAGSGE